MAVFHCDVTASTLFSLAVKYKSKVHFEFKTIMSKMQETFTYLQVI